MRGVLSTVLAAAGGTHAIAFVNPAGWAPPRIKPSKPWGRGVQNLKAQQTLTLDVDSSMIARPDKAARGEWVC